MLHDHKRFQIQCSCSQELGKQVTYAGKNFLMANLDNYSNKILCLDYGVGAKQMSQFRTKQFFFLAFFNLKWLFMWHPVGTW